MQILSGWDAEVGLGIRYASPRSVEFSTRAGLELIRINMQVPLTDVQVLQDPAEVETVAGEKDETFAHMKEWKRQYMRGISHTPSQAGVYYEALKGSSHSLAKGCAKI